MRKIDLERKIYSLTEDLFFFAHDEKLCNFQKGELAKVSKLSKSTLYKLRTKRTKDPRYSTILKLAHALGFDPQILPSESGGFPHNTSAGKNLRAKILKLRKVS